MDNRNRQVQHFTLISTRPLKVALAIVLAVAVLEVVGGILSNSLALLSDAGHMLVDILALALALFAATLARRPITQQRTYGYHRAEIMAALANGTTLVVLALYIFYAAYGRFTDPPPINTPIMLLVATLGLIANIIGILVLRRGRHKNLNIRAAFWHVVGDTISSVGVIVAAVIIAITGWRVADPIIAVFIGGIILWGAARLVGESANILLEIAPKHIPMDGVIGTMKRVPGVEEVHDVHIWTITSGMHAMSAHLLITDQMVSRSTEIIAMVNQSLAQHYDIRHTTLQLECQSCSTPCVCEVSGPPHPPPAAGEPDA